MTDRPADDPRAAARRLFDMYGMPKVLHPTDARRYIAETDGFADAVDALIAKRVEAAVADLRRERDAARRERDELDVAIRALLPEGRTRSLNNTISSLRTRLIHMLGGLDVRTQEDYALACALRGPDSIRPGAFLAKTLTTAIIRDALGVYSHSTMVLTPQRASRLASSYTEDQFDVAAIFLRDNGHFLDHLVAAVPHLRGKHREAVSGYIAALRERDALAPEERRT